MSVNRDWTAVLPGVGRVVKSVSGDATVIRATGEETAGLAAVFEQTCAPGSGPPLHVHNECAEMFFVLDGEFMFRAGDDTVSAPAGTFVFVRASLPHAYVNSGTAPARLLFWTTPSARMIGWFSELGELPPGPADLDRVRAIAARHGIEVVGPPLEL